MLKEKNLIGIFRALSLVVIVLLDQVSKYWVTQNIHHGDEINIIPGFKFILAYNYGVAFSIFNDGKGDYSNYLLIFASFITGAILIWLFKTPKKEKYLSLGLIFIAGGAIGNILDRVQHGFVVDFIDIYFNNWHWPTFNIADSFITVGAIFALVATWLQKD
jgi:signal peptidase II